MKDGFLLCYERDILFASVVRGLRFFVTLIFFPPLFPVSFVAGWAVGLLGRGLFSLPGIFSLSPLLSFFSIPRIECLLRYPRNGVQAHWEGMAGKANASTSFGRWCTHFAFAYTIPRRRAGASPTGGRACRPLASREDGEHTKRDARRTER